jgi:hypothetical protein
MDLRSGRAEGVPYSLSRWTDVPAAKWDWFKGALEKGSMQAFDPRTGVPDWWSLKPEETQALLFWTKDPKVLVQNERLLRPFHVKAHVTITSWEEVEHGAPDPIDAAFWFDLLGTHFGKENVSWRFSPVPLVPDVVERFKRLCDKTWAKKVYISFLQPNDKIPETRDAEERVRLMVEMARVAADFGVHVILCNEDQTLVRALAGARNLSTGVCVPPGEFAWTPPQAEKCGCAVMVDPFTINETCTFGCTYCYAADKTLAVKKRNSSKGLPVIR